MKLILRGYFNHNLGDDFMIKTFIEQTPSVDYLVEEKNEYTKFLENMPNVSFGKVCDNLYPTVTITGSGLMVNSRASLKCEVKNLLLRREKSDFYIGCNIEPFKSRIAEFVIKQKLKSCKFISCRDKASLFWFSKNFTKTKLTYHPDILFSMPDKLLLGTCSDAALGISVMKTGNEKTDMRFVNDMADIIDRYTEGTKGKVFLFAFSMGSENDYELCKQIQNRAKHKDNTEIVCYFGDGTKLLQSFAKLSRFIAVRFHSAVLAIKMGIPMYPILYRDKMRNLIKDLNYNIKGSDITAIDKDEIREFITNDAKPYLLDEKIKSESKKHSKDFVDYIRGEEDA